MHSTSKGLRLWGVLMLLCLGLLIQQTLFSENPPIETNILALLPENQQDKIAQAAFQQITDNINNRVVFLVAGKDKKILIDAADAFQKQLSQLGLFAQIETQVSEDEQQAWASLYFPYRAQLLSEQAKLQLNEAPEKRITHVVQQLYNPFSGISGSELKSDPFLLFRDYLSARNNSDSNFSLYQNYLISSVADSHYLMIQADLAGDAYDGSLQQRVPQLIQLEKEIAQRYQVKLLHTGTLFYATYGTESAEGEISTIGIGSLLGIILLLLLVYRSALPLVLALLSISCGLLVAFVVTILVFGKVHIFSLVFGASLIGVSIDYAFHFLTERLMHSKNWNANVALKQIINAISLGLLTSVIGYIGLFAAPFPGLQQLALFSVVGLISAYLTVVLCYPTLAKKASTCKQPKLAILKSWLYLWKNNYVRFLLPSGLFLLALLGLTQIHFDDDIRQLQAMPSELKQQETTIKSITGVGNNQRLLLLRAESEEALLQRLEDLSLTLTRWKSEKLIVNFQSIDQFIPSLETQQANYQLVKSLHATQGERLAKTLNMIDPITFSAAFSPLTIDQYLGSSVSKPLGFLWLGEVEGQYATVIVLSEVSNLALVDTYVAEHLDLTTLDKASEISTIFAHYRLFIGKMLIAVYLLISLLLIWRYGVNLAFKVLAPPFIAGLVALAITVVFAIPITIFNLLALLLVLGIGIDYTLFFAEQKAGVNTENTLLAITLSSITTLLSFGLLALSETQAIHGFGVTVFTGIVVAWLLAPLAMQNRINR